MKLHDSVDRILKHKGSGVYSISPDETVYHALEALEEKNVGALLVMSGDVLVGLLSERDYVRKVKLKGHSSTELKVSEKTIEVHRARVMQKMEADSLAELVRLSMAVKDEGVAQTA